MNFESKNDQLLISFDNKYETVELCKVLEDFLEEKYQEHASLNLKYDDENIKEEMKKLEEKRKYIKEIRIKNSN